jgi:hypothetical protein
MHSVKVFRFRGLFTRKQNKFTHSRGLKRVVIEENSRVNARRYQTYSYTKWQKLQKNISGTVTSPYP